MTAHQAITAGEEEAPAWIIAAHEAGRIDGDPFFEGATDER